MVPPSSHPSGERLTWSESGAPTKLPYAVIGAAVRKVAAGALLARRWPNEGSRNEAALALGGALLRSEMPVDVAIEFVERVADAAGDEEAAERGLTVAATARKLQENAAATGFRKLKEMVGDESALQAFKWLREAGEIRADTCEWEAPILFEQMLLQISLLR